ncbi:sterol desaturase [Flavobacterium sp. 316]|uniref:Sterol desaturase family protein n=1 Tax=Flavobacterium sediminilitoris TaxID=2024526 RepID=A0ABY4HRY5_9FLAO|nr:MULTISPECIES: sterol desaturase family protein [Flavobacterium]KIX21527.1 sterol desaturase [Flavobacterium sp. 316]UOX34269.1 sterol desaturase family protein [Flavobacterium sediminilitoris]
MNKYKEIIINSYSDYFNYLKNELVTLHIENYFYGLIFISLVVFILELLFPWRKNQPVFRKDFWLDTFYMFFNFFLLNMIILIAMSNVTAQLFNDILSSFNIELKSLQIIDLSSLPKALSLFIFFIVSDFVQWNTHRLLHRFDFFWNFHKVHHSVKEMGFAAHLRYHWMEPVVYKSLLYIPMAIIGGFSVEDVFIVHFIAITIGHLNHANLGWDYGVFKYIINNPKMHIWHHSKEMPRKYGANYGISLSLWDYLFKSNYIPKDGKDIVLGFEEDEQFPDSFLKQEAYPLKF